MPLLHPRDVFYGTGKTANFETKQNGRFLKRGNIVHFRHVKKLNKSAVLSYFGSQLFSPIFKNWLFCCVLKISCLVSFKISSLSCKSISGRRCQLINSPTVSHVSAQTTRLESPKLRIFMKLFLIDSFILAHLNPKKPPFDFWQIFLGRIFLPSIFFD